jgi:hypothetical protein
MTQDHLKKILDYNPETGLFHWKVKPSKRFPAGMQAGSLIHGYIRIHTNGRQYGAHRLAWLYVYGVKPEYQIDHINGNGNIHRKEVSGYKMYPLLKRDGFPLGYQTLCMNCQFIKKDLNKECKRRWM